MSITDSLKNRKHVVDYSTTEIPTRKDIEEILRTALPLVTSKQKGYPYQVYVLGPNAERSKKLYNLCEGNKIETDEVAGMGDPKKYILPKPIFNKGGCNLSFAGLKTAVLKISKTIKRVNKNKIQEVILATSATVEGQTTAYYIQESLKNTKAKITKLAQGLPVGGEIENLDDGTLFSAFKNRSDMNST